MTGSLIRHLILVAVVWGSPALMADPGGQQAQGIRLAFLRGGEVWIGDARGLSASQLTRTKGLVDHFAISPDGAYIAYAQTIRYVDDVGLFEPGEKPPKRSVHAIVIETLRDRRRIARLEPGDEWIVIDRWLPDGRVVGHSSSGFDVSDVFQFDVATRQRTSLGLDRGGRLLGGDAAVDGTLTVYVDDTGAGPTYQQRLHVVERGTDAVRASRRSLMSPKVAHDKSAVAFIHVTDGGRQSRDQVWILDLATSNLRSIYEDAARPKSGDRSGLSWSLDDRYVAVNYGGTATVIDTRSAGNTNVQFRGNDVCWISATELVAAGESGLDVVEAASGARRTIVRDARSPQCVGPR